MALRRLQDPKRAPSAKKVTIGWMDGYRLTFDKVSRDGSGKCDCEHTGNPADRAYGVVYEIARADESALDQAEGLNRGYDKQVIEAATDAGSLIAIVYIATRKAPGLKPYDWYKEHVLRGARENGLPVGYVRAIEAVEAMPDPDPRRAAKEMAIWTS